MASAGIVDVVPFRFLAGANILASGRRARGIEWHGDLDAGAAFIRLVPSAPAAPTRLPLWLSSGDTVAA
jgi:hypothetical protein